MKTLRPSLISESACKPGSVVGNHSSRPYVTVRLKQPTRRQRGPRQCLPIWSCSKWGLPSRSLLPGARCALTAPFHHHHASLHCVRLSLSVALSVSSRRPGVTWHFALWSPDFPRHLVLVTRLPSELGREGSTPKRNRCSNISTRALRAQTPAQQAQSSLCLIIRVANPTCLK